MRWLINYLRQCFCKHDFEITETAIESTRSYCNIEISKTQNIKVSLICKKCGYHKSYWKY